MKYSKSKILSLVLAVMMLFGNARPVHAASNKEAQAEARTSYLGGYYGSAQNQTTGKVRVVIELEDKPIATIASSTGRTVRDLSANQVMAYEKKILATQDNVKNALEANNIQTYKTADDNKTYADYSFTTVLNGFSTYVNAADIPKIEKLREVKRVHYVNEYHRPADSPQMIFSDALVKSRAAWDTGYKGDGMVVAVLDSGYDLGHKDFKISNPDQATLTKSKVDNYISLYDLPGKYYDAKFPYAYNYYDHTDRILNTVNNHGQHVAGTIAANGDEATGGVKGVAPEAQLLGMKVFSDDPLFQTTLSDIYVKAIDDSVKLGADAINMSLGSPAGNHVYASLEDEAINSARDAGVIVAIAAGNEHSVVDGLANFGNMLAGNQLLPYAKNADTSVIASPSLYNGDLSVASVNNIKFIADHIIRYEIDGKSYNANLSISEEAPSPFDHLKGTYTTDDFVYINRANMGPNTDAPGKGPSFDGKDVSGKIVLVERGNSFANTVVEAQNRGAKAVIVYNNTRPDEEVLLKMLGGDKATIPLMITTRSNGLRIIDAIDNKRDLKLTFPEESAEVDHPYPGEVSLFTSWGPTPELKIKPEIAAPGGDIYSLDNGDSYTTMSGTSMATPHVAGGLALVNQRLMKDSQIFGISDKTQRGNMAKLLLMNTAVPAKTPQGVPYLVRQQGAGVMDLSAATSIDTYVVDKNTGEGKSEIGSIRDTKIVLNYTIYNKSRQRRKFDVTANALTDAKFVDQTSNYEYLQEAPYQIKNIKVSGGGVQYVGANSKKDVRVTIDFTEAVNQSEIKDNSFIEGFVSFKSLDNKVDMSVPYLGFFGDYEELKVLDEPLYNLWDSDRTNDPFFNTTQLMYQVNGEVQGEVPTHTPTYFNSSNQGLGNTGIASRITPLRNFDRIEFAIEGDKGNVLENLGTTQGNKKITNMARGVEPYAVFSQGFWDGKINGNYLEEGQKVYYSTRAYFLRDSKPQTMKFELVADNSFPKAGKIEGEMKTRKFYRDGYFIKDYDEADVELDYYPESRIISFKATDNEKGSGINRITLVNFENGKDTYAYTFFGAEDLSYIRNKGDKYNGEYMIELGVFDDNPFTGDYILVEIADAANNIVQGYVKTREVTENKEPLPTPTIEGNAILSGQQLVNGHVDRANIDVGMERIFADRSELIAETKADAEGNFTFDLTDAKLAVGDELIIYSTNEGRYSEPLRISVADPNPTEPDLDPAGDELTMYILTPDLGWVWDGEAHFEIVMFGWDNVDRVTFAGHEFDVKTVERERVIKPGTDEQVYYGKVFKVNASLDLADGYYNTPITAYDDRNGREYGITRRFWVDTTKPEFKEIITSAQSIDTKDAEGNRIIEITTDKASVDLSFTVEEKGPELYVFKNDTLISDKWTYDKSGWEPNLITHTFNEVINLGDANEATIVYTLKDIPGNEDKVTVNITRERPEVQPNGLVPRIEAHDRTVFVGETVDPLYQVKAYTHDGKDITDKVKVLKGQVDTSKPGDYEIEYHVIDTDGWWASLPVTFTVKPRTDNGLYKNDFYNSLEKAKKITGEDYTLGSFQELQRAIDRAIALDKSIKASQDEIDAMDAELQSYIDNLVYVVELRDFLGYAMDEYTFGAEEWTSRSLSILKRRIDSANQVLANEYASQRDVDLALKRLKPAVDGLIRVADKSKLIGLYDSINNSINNNEITKEKYTSESVDALIEQLNKAKLIIENAEATEEDVNTSYENLSEALTNIQEIKKATEVDKTKLSTLYEQANSLELDKYTPESVEKLAEANRQAYINLTDDAATEEDVNDAYEKLSAALEALVEKANKSQLENELKQLENVEKDLYTEESYNKFKESYEKAKALIEDENASQEDVDNALQDVRDKFEALEKKPADVRGELEDLIAKAENEVKKPGYTSQTISNLKRRIILAKRALNKVNVTDEELKDQIEQLTHALMVLR